MRAPPPVLPSVHHTPQHPWLLLSVQRAHAHSHSLSRSRAHLYLPALLTHQQVILITLEWRDLTYKVVVGKRKQRTFKTILDGLSGAVSPGRLLAVMGPTGW